MTPMQEWFDELKNNYPYFEAEIFKKGFHKYIKKEKDFARLCIITGVIFGVALGISILKMIQEISN